MIKCWKCGKKFEDTEEGKENRVIHWEYIHAGLETDSNIDKSQRTHWADKSIVKEYKQ